MSPVMLQGSLSFDVQQDNTYSLFLERFLNANWQEVKWKKKLLNQTGIFIHKEDGWTFRKFYVQVGVHILYIPYDYVMKGHRHRWGKTLAEFVPLHYAHCVKAVIVHDCKLKHNKIVYDRLLRYDLRKINLRLSMICYGNCKY